MEFDDPVYGEQTVEREVVVDIIESQPFERLKGVNQAGPQRFYGYPEKKVTRYSHSLGVFFLLRSFGAPLEEQLAGLLHDISHTAFSHVADFVFENEEHEFHEEVIDDVVYSSDLPEILERHGFETSEILDDSDFSLLERQIPDLCADRIDYFFRDLRVVGGEDIDSLFKALDTIDGEFVLSDRDAAEDYALRYIDTDERWWANPHEVAVLELYSRAVRRGLETGVLEDADLFRTDDHLHSKIVDSEDAEIDRPLKKLDDGFEVFLNDEEYDFYVETKARYVDPKILDEKVRVSEVSQDVRQKIEEHREKVGSGYHIRLVD